MRNYILNKPVKHSPFIEVFRLEELPAGTFDHHQRFNFHQVLWSNEINGTITFSIDFTDFEMPGHQAVVIYPYQNVKIDLTDKEGYLFLIHNFS